MCQSVLVYLQLCNHHRCNSRTFSLPRKQNLCPPQDPGNHQSTFCFYRFAYSSSVTFFCSLIFLYICFPSPLNTSSPIQLFSLETTSICLSFQRACACKNTNTRSFMLFLYHQWQHSVHMFRTFLLYILEVLKYFNMWIFLRILPY